MSFISRDLDTLAAQVRDCVFRGRLDPKKLIELYDSPSLKEFALEFSLPVENKLDDRVEVLRRTVLQDLAAHSGVDSDELSVHADALRRRVSATPKKQKKYRIADLVNELTAHEANERLGLVAVKELADIIIEAGLKMEPDLKKLRESPGVDAAVLLSLPADDVAASAAEKGAASSSPAEVTPAVPNSGNYVDKKKLGEGMHGETWLAEQLSTRRPVVIKRPSASAKTTQRRQERRELKILRSLKHRNVVSIIDILPDESLVMEHCELGSLDKQTKETLKVPSTAAHVMAAVLDGVEYIHGEGVLHRDLKDSNVLVSAHWDIKICDFGLALMNSTDAGTQTAAPLAGTAGWFPPEQWDDEATHDHVDIFSLGVLLYWLHTRALPTTRVGMQKTNREKLEPALDAVVDRCTRLKPTERPASVAELRTMLSSFLSQARRPP